MTQENKSFLNSEIGCENLGSDLNHLGYKVATKGHNMRQQTHKECGINQTFKSRSNKQETRHPHPLRTDAICSLIYASCNLNRLNVELISLHIIAQQKRA